METPLQLCTRLVTALEDLAGQESAALQSRDFAAAVTIQDRVAPVIELLVAHADDVTPPLRARIAEVQRRRQQHGEWLAEQIVAVRAELAQMDASKRRVARLAPAYCVESAPVISRQLSAVG